VGVPEINPFDELRDNPGGKLPALILHTRGVVPPEAVTVCE
jgi:hypothetical protein